MAEGIEHYMKILRQSYDSQAEYIKEIRSLKHDMQAHMIVLQHCLEEGNYEKAKMYLREMQVYQEKTKRPQIDTGNNMINAVIMERWRQSDADIKVVCFDEIPSDICISEYDLCTIFSNLFSNAIEACEKLVQKDKEIVIEMKKYPDRLEILVENPIEWKVDMALLGNGSDKKDKESHGFGIRNVLQAVAKNAGTVQFFTTEERFVAKISFPDFDKKF